MSLPLTMTRAEAAAFLGVTTAELDNVVHAGFGDFRADGTLKTTTVRSLMLQRAVARFHSGEHGRADRCLDAAGAAMSAVEGLGPGPWNHEASQAAAHLIQLSRHLKTRALAAETVADLDPLA